MTGMIKVEQQPRTYIAIRAIGSGIQNLLFADCRTVADAEECVRSVRAETPATGGIHGVGSRRDVSFVLEGGTPAYVQALEDSVVALMVEKAPAGRGSRQRPLGQRHRHGPVWTVGLLDEPGYSGSVLRSPGHRRREE